MTDPTPASDRELESLRAQHVPVEFANLTGLRCRWSGHAWPCRTASLLARLDEAERQRDWYADPRIDHHRDGPHLGWTCCPHGPDQSTTGGLCDTCGMPKPDPSGPVEGGE